MILNETIINGQKIKTNCRYLIKKGFFSYEEIKVLEITDKFVKLHTGWKSHSSLKVICKLPTLQWKDEFELWNWYDAMNLQRNGWKMPTIQELIEAGEDKIPGFNGKYWSSNLITNDSKLMAYCFNGEIVMDKQSNKNHVKLCREI